MVTERGGGGREERWMHEIVKGTRMYKRVCSRVLEGVLDHPYR